MQTNLLKAERARFGLTQSQVAKVLGKEISSYAKKENGQIEFTAMEICILKNLFKLSPKKIDEIFFEQKLELNSI